MRWDSKLEDEQLCIKPGTYAADACKRGDVGMEAHSWVENKYDVAALAKESNYVETLHIIKVRKEEL